MELPTLNFCTDGDGTQRRAINSLMSFLLNLESPFEEIIGMLPLGDLLVGELNETSNFHVKHLVKRCTVKIQGITLLKVDIKKLLQLLTIDSHDVEKIIYPRDKENVPTAIACLLKFGDVIKTDKINLILYKLYQIKNKLKLLAAVYEGLLCLYSYVDLSIS